MNSLKNCLTFPKPILTKCYHNVVSPSGLVMCVCERERNTIYLTLSPDLHVLKTEALTLHMGLHSLTPAHHTTQGGEHRYMTSKLSPPRPQLSLYAGTTFPPRSQDSNWPLWLACRCAQRILWREKVCWGLSAETSRSSTRLLLATFDYLVIQQTSFSANQAPVRKKINHYAEAFLRGEIEVSRKLRREKRQAR